mgnify:CR=1 FL=1
MEVIKMVQVQVGVMMTMDLWSEFVKRCKEEGKTKNGKIVSLIKKDLGII